MPFKVGVVRDERYLLHQPGLVHPERPARLKALYRMMDKDFGPAVINIEPEFATLEHLEMVHTPAYIRKILRTAERAFTNLAPDTPVGSRSYVAAWLAVGGCIKGLQALLAGRCHACVALIRPPGHHALADRAGGFCIFNNVGVAARYALERHRFQRILIIDWDIHHGNGIQDLFYEAKEVFYFSTHHTGWYPHTGDWEETGVGEGLGYNLNIPVPKDITDADLTYVYAEILGPVMRRFRPEIILVAAGFDGHKRDPIGRTQLTEGAYRTMTEILLETRDAVRAPPILMALEGGYDVAALSGSVREVIQALIQGGRRRPLNLSSGPTGARLVEKARSIHGKYRVWTD
ncbi:MAG: histone deacetylase [Desulfomonilaceae bacterium]|nr:histone deacetylase [Desulfomonilaceae bacterium]